MNFTKTIIEAIKHWVNGKLDNYVEVVEGKGLSTEDYTTEEKEKLATLGECAQANWNQTDETQKDFIRNKPVEQTPDDAMDLLAETGVLEFVADEDGSILTDENDNILTI